MQRKELPHKYQKSDWPFFCWQALTNIAIEQYTSTAHLEQDLGMGIILMGQTGYLKSRFACAIWQHAFLLILTPRV